MYPLQLGAGTALPGVLAGRLGAHVTLSDACHLTHCLDNCQRSCQANDLTGVKVIGLTWGQFSPEVLQLGQMDVILGSDCFYDTKGDVTMVHDLSNTSCVYDLLDC